MTRHESDSVNEPEQHHERDRRRYFRIDDRVGLVFTPISPDAEAELITSIDQPGARAGLLNELQAIRERHLPERRNLEYKFPTVLAYVKVLESQIETLALAIGHGEGFPVSADTDVSLSAQGLSLKCNEAFQLGLRGEMRLTLFPDRRHIRALAQVIRCTDEEAHGHRTALDFVHLREADREAIIRHIYTLQRLQLQAQAEEAFEARMRQRSAEVQKPHPKRG